MPEQQQPPGDGRGSGSSKKRDPKKSGDTGKKRGSGSSGKTASGGRKGTASTGKRGTKRAFEETTGELITTRDANGIASRRITRAMSKSISKPECQEKVGTGTSAIHRIESLHISGLASDLTEFERDSGAPFTRLPTSAPVPCLRVLGMREGAVGTVYGAFLQSPDGSDTADKSDKPTFFIKVIDASWLTYEEYRNSFDELIKEYKAYYLLALAKCAGRFSDIIEKFTPTCYGLYRAKDKSQDVFALITDHAGTVVFDDWKTWSGSDKLGVIQSLLALHSLGLYHGDAEERNVGVRHNGKDNTFRFFDFGNSHWHKCPGIEICEELKVAIRCIYNLQEPPWVPLHFQERTVREYALPFCNLEELMGGTELSKYKQVVRRLKRPANRYEVDFSQWEE